MASSTQQMFEVNIWVVNGDEVDWLGSFLVIANEQSAALGEGIRKAIQFLGDEPIDDRPVFDDRTKFFAALSTSYRGMLTDQNE